MKLTQVSKIYEGKIMLKDVDFTFEQGRFYALRGESGCGKTTLLNLLAGYLLPDTGEIKCPQKIAYLFQDEMLFSNLTVAENLRIRLYTEDMELPDEREVLRTVLERLHIGSLLDRKVTMLSGGERQRVELAGMLLGRPDVVLLDEPTAKLDEANKRNILEIIMNECKGKTVIAVTHEKELFPKAFIGLRLQGGTLCYEK